MGLTSAFLILIIREISLINSGREIVYESAGYILRANKWESPLLG